MSDGAPFVEIEKERLAKTVAFRSVISSWFAGFIGLSLVLIGSPKAGFTFLGFALLLFCVCFALTVMVTVGCFKKRC